MRKRDLNKLREARAARSAQYIVESRGTVRSAAQEFHIAKSTVHKDLTKVLPYVDRSLYRQTQEILAKNLAERHLRGGAATKERHQAAKAEKRA